MRIRMMGLVLGMAVIAGGLMPFEALAAPVHPATVDGRSQTDISRTARGDVIQAGWRDRRHNHHWRRHNYRHHGWHDRRWYGYRGNHWGQRHHWRHYGRKGCRIGQWGVRCRF